MSSPRDAERRTKSAGRPRSKARRSDGSRTSLSPARIRDASSSRRKLHSSSSRRQESSRSRMSRKQSSRSRRSMGNTSPGSEGISDRPMMMTPSSNQRRKVATLSDYLLNSNDDRSRKGGKGSMHSEDSRKARSILTKKSTRIHRHAPPPHVIQPTSPQNSEEKKIDNSQEESLAMDLFQACEDCKWKVLYELMCGLQNSSDEKMRRILSIPDTANESTILHICVWKAPPALTKFIMDIIPQDLYLTTDADGNTPLHLCCGNLPIYSNGSTDVSVMKRLAKAAPHALHLANVHGDTPLHMLVSSPVCCNTEHDEALALVAEEAVGYLLDMDENLCRLQDASGALPLHVAIGCGANEAILVKLFEAAPTVAAAKDEMGMLPIHYVAAFGKTPLTVVDLLMEANPESFTEVTVDGDTPLHILASNASTSMADLSTQRMNLETEKMIEFLVGGCGDDDASRATDEQSVTSYGGKIRPLIASNKEQVRQSKYCLLIWETCNLMCCRPIDEPASLLCSIQRTVSISEAVNEESPWI